MQAVAEAGVEDSYELYAAHVASKQPASDYPRWLEKAARAGHAHSQHLLALDLQKSKEKNKQELAENWLLESARNGNLQAIKSIADGLYDEKRWEEAAVWYESAANEGDVDSSLELASIYAMAPKGTDYTEQDAADIYKSLSENNDSAAARREWSDLLIFGKTLKHDLVKARQLLQQDADKNDPASMVALGSRLLNGEFGAKDEKAGMSWLKKADASGSLMATNAIATYLYYLKGDADSLKDAKMYWGKAALRKYMPAVNNFAWALCTSSYPGFLDAGFGFDLFKMSADIEHLAPSHRDTYAACLAANGDFKSAIVQQQMVIEEMKKRGFENDSSMPEMNQRLALYRKNLTYLEPAKSKSP